MQRSFYYKGEFYANRCVMFLCVNALDYPLYDNPGDGFDIKQPKKNAYRTGIYFGGSRKLPKGFPIDYGDKCR